DAVLASAPAATAIDRDRSDRNRSSSRSESPAPERAAGASAVASTATSDTVSDAVTITGCLETTADENEFRLTDTEGTDAPKARNWRSGFLKKRSAPVDLEGPDPAVLRKYVGRHVTATGTLTGRQLRLRSLQVGSACE
ncbi:MAG TPA: hypothetical protein VF456_01670, partial [Vicinamibacterales bacterium]